MKPWRLCLLLLLAVLLPLRAVAAGGPCPAHAASAGAHHHAPRAQGPHDAHQAHPYPAHQAHQAHQAHGNPPAAAVAHHAPPARPDPTATQPAGPDACSHCAACCTATPLPGSALRVAPAPPAGRPGFAVLTMPRLRFERDGPDRPPRAA